MSRGWLMRVGTVAAGLVLTVAFCPDGGLAAAATPDLRAVAGFGAAAHVTEGETGGIGFGYDGATGNTPVTIDVDLSGLPSSLQYRGNPVMAGTSLGSACTWWSGHNGFTCTETSNFGNQGSLSFTAPVGSGGSSGTYRVTVHSSEPDSNPADNSVSPTVVLDRILRTDLALSFKPGAALVGEVAQVRMAVHDNGPDGPPQWMMSVVAPAGTTYLGCEPANCMGGLSIDVGQTVVVTLYFRIESPAIGAGSWSIQADADRSDPVPANDVLPALGSLIRAQAGPLPTGTMLTASPASGGFDGAGGATGTGAGTRGDGRDGATTVDPVTGLPVPAGTGSAAPSLAPGAAASPGHPPTTPAAALRTSGGGASWKAPAIASVAVAAALCLLGVFIARRRRLSNAALDSQES